MGNAAAATGCMPTKVHNPLVYPEHMAISHLGATQVDPVATALRLTAIVDEVYQAPESWANKRSLS